MKKKVIAYIENDGLYDERGVVMYSALTAGGWVFKDAEEGKSTDGVIQLASLGYSAEDLIRLKASGII